jgi:RimJ/RimL family protein N-acetyltransferase
VPRTREETRIFLERVLTAYREDSLGHLAVYLKDSNTLIGRCGLTLTEIEAEPTASKPPQCFWFRASAPTGMPVVNEIELGYTLARQHWGCGYATECATALRDYGFRELGLSQLLSAIAPLNIASRNVARKLGLTCSGLLTCFGTTFERHDLSRDRWLELTAPSDPGR